jgi:hypothetical protein
MYLIIFGVFFSQPSCSFLKNESTHEARWFRWLYFSLGAYLLLYFITGTFGNWAISFQAVPSQPFLQFQVSLYGTIAGSGTVSAIQPKYVDSPSDKVQN